MLKVSADTVRKQCNSWVSDYQDNNTRGKECVVFAVGEQWRSQDVDFRIINNKESLTFNLCKKHLQRVRSQSKQIEFNLNLSPVNKEDADIEETNAFRMVLHDVLMGEVALKKYSDTLDKCIDYGYSFIEVNFGYQDDKSLCLIPKLITHEDPSIAFWDKNALSPFKTDGRFCGLWKQLTKEEFLNKYPQYKDDSGWLKDINNDVYDYWYRDYVTKKFYLLNTQVYKREDLISSDDEFDLSKDGKPQFKTADVCVIMFQRTCNRRVINKPVIFPSGHKLPMPYHPGLTAWTDRGWQTFPFIHDMRDPQKLHNYVNSQIAVAAKNTTADKWIFNESHVKTKRAQEDAKSINIKEGAFVFDTDPNGKEVRREIPAEIPMSLINFSGVTKQEIDEIAGANIDAANSSQQVLSGVALDKITGNINMLQVGLFAKHIEWVNEVACIQKMMIPQLYTEERTIVIKKSDGSSEKICINKYDPTIKAIVKNNIKDIDDRFHYEIKAGPSTEMENQNTLMAIQAVAQAAPQAFVASLDIYARCLKTPFAEELARRWGAGIDPDLIKYSQGQIPQEEFMQIQKQKMQAQMQQRMQMEQQSPQYQSMMHLAQAENQKAQAQQFDAETKRQESMGKSQAQMFDLQTKRQDSVNKAMAAQGKLQIEMFKAMNEQDFQKKEQMMQEIQMQLDQQNQIIQDLTNANATTQAQE